MVLPDYAITKTSICNYAITVGGLGELIDDIDATVPANEQTEQYKLCRLLFWQAIFETMEAGEWGFATTRVEIAKNATDAVIGQRKYRYAVPTDMLRMSRQIDEDSDDVQYDYKIEGDWILSVQTDSDDNGYFIYIKEITDVSKFSSLFVKAAYTNLAIKLRLEIKGVGDGEWDLRLQREYKDIMEDALGLSEIQDWDETGNDDVLNAAGGGCGTYNQGYWKGTQWIPRGCY